MSLFGAIVRTAVNTAALPVAAVKDALTLGNIGDPKGSFTVQAIQRLKDEAEVQD